MRNEGCHFLIPNDKNQMSIQNPMTQPSLPPDGGATAGKANVPHFARQYGGLRGAGNQ